MPIRLISTSARDKGTTEPATVEDKAHLIRTNTQSPGLRGMLGIPIDPTYKTAILIINLFNYACVVIDFTVTMGNPNSIKDLKPMQEGTLRYVIFCNDFIYAIELLLSLCRTRAKLEPHRSMIILVIEFLSFIPYELIYIILSGQNVIFNFGLRLRYVIRLIRYVVQVWQDRKVKLSMVYLTILHCVVFSTICMMAVCIRLYIECQSEEASNFKIIRCHNLTKFDFYYTYVILNAQISPSGMLFVGEPYHNFRLLDSLLQVIAYIWSILFIAKMIAILFETRNEKYKFCLFGSQVLECATFKNESLKEMDIVTLQKKHFQKALTKYMISYWRHYQIERLQKTYIANFKVATIPSVINAEINLDITWDMFKHSLLFRNEHVAFLRHVAKVTQYTFGAKNHVICRQGTFRDYMIYIVRGVISLMSESNGSTPVISLAGGTVLGELHLFLNIPSATTIYCTTYCEYMVLTKSNFLEVKKVYPGIYDKLKKACMQRIAIAKNYDFIAKDMYKNGEVTLPKSKLSIRYIKFILRSCTATQPTLTQTLFLPVSMKPERTLSTTLFTTKFLCLYVEASRIASDQKTHFVTKGLNFKMKPNSSLLYFWKRMIGCTALLYCLTYPYGASLNYPLYTNFFDFYVLLITFCYVIDFLSFNYIALYKSDKLITEFDLLFSSHIQTVDFWLDFLACIPFEILMILMDEPMAPGYYRLMTINRGVKIVKVIRIINHQLFFSPMKLLLIRIAQSSYGILLMLSIGYLVFHKFEYFEICNIDIEDSFITKLSIVYQFYFSMAEVGMRINRDVIFLPMIGLQMLGMYTLMILFSLNAATFTLIFMPQMNLENQLDNIKRNFVLFHFPYALKKRMLKYMTLHYDSRELLRTHLTNKPKSRKMMGESLYKMQHVKKYLKFYESLDMYKFMSYGVIYNMCEIGKIVMIPRGEVVILAGSLVKNFYFIMRGECEYISFENKADNKTLERGYAIGLLEAIHGHRALKNVFAATDCQLLSVPIDQFKAHLVKYPHELIFFKGALQEDMFSLELRRLQGLERSIYPMFEDNESCRYYENMIKFTEEPTVYRLLNIMLMKQTITPYGRFWISWEIIHLVVVYIYALFGVIPITISCNFTEPWYWLFRLMDLYFIVDIYLRHHIVFFTEGGIEIQHPWECAKRYWHTSLGIDLLATFPIELIVLPYVSSMYLYTLCSLRVNRFFRLYRLLGLRSFLIHEFLKTYKLEVMLSTFCFSWLIYNYAIVSLLFTGERIQIIDGSPILFDGDNDVFWEKYIHHVYSGIEQIYNIGIFDGFTKKDLWVKVCMNAMGQIVITNLACFLIGMSIFRYSHLMVYQIKMQRLLLFLNLRRIDKNLCKEIIKHFEYLWVLHEGKTIGETLIVFNDNFTEEIYHCYFSSILQGTILFANFPKVILKELMSTPTIARRVIIINGIILRVNDVQGMIYIVYKGIVNVLGPDYSYLRQLRVGSLFGCLDSVESHRSTLTYVAKTHCEFLCIPSIAFHEIMNKYRRYYNFYLSLLYSSNFDYIPCNATAQRSNLKNKKKYSILLAKKLNRTQQFLVKVFPVLHPNKYVILFFNIFITINWFFECLLIISLYKYFEVMVYIAYFLDLMFLVKIYVDFSTSYEDHNGYKIDLRSWIAIRYLHTYTGFVFHFLVSFPIELFYNSFPGEYNHHKLWAYMRFNRLFKIILVLNYLRSLRQKLNVKVKLISILYIFMVIFTVQQLCIIALSHYIDDIPYFSAYVYHTYVISKRLYTPWGLQVPNKCDELFYKLDYIIVVIISELVLLYILSDSVATFATTTFSRFKYQTFIHNQQKVMELVGVSKPILDRVMQYCQKLVYLGVNVQYPSFLIEAPYYLREGVLDSMFGFYLRKHPVFKKCHKDFIRQVAATYKTAYFFEGDYLTFQGDIDGKMYFIYSGEIEGLVEDNMYFDISDSKYLPGDYIGFHQIIHKNVGHSRTYKVVSKNALILYIKRENVINLLKFFPASKHVIFNSKGSNDGLEKAKVEYRDYKT